ncbi:hypothetical protein [Streptomyces mirabilis]|uniref:hypothetical protein n=1 Tax=Streptomyces mirabilis TaxID=68239 RepID=UPI0036DD574D
MLQLAGTLQHSLSYSGLSGDEVDLMLRSQIRVSWNALAALASPWRGQEGYDVERWRPVRYWDAMHESEIEGLLSDVLTRGRKRENSSGQEG